MQVSCEGRNQHVSVLEDSHDNTEINIVKDEINMCLYWKTVMTTLRLILYMYQSSVALSQLWLNSKHYEAIVFSKYIMTIILAAQ